MRPPFATHLASAEIRGAASGSQPSCPGWQVQSVARTQRFPAWLAKAMLVNGVPPLALYAFSILETNSFVESNNEW